jgi:peptidoglycan/xylan/chitin deacetylase (PgdA/CDA1 family)
MLSAKPSRAAQALILALAFLAPAGRAGLSAQAPRYAPLGERREILHPWEKSGGAKPPEIVAGIYERDFQAHDFKNKLAISIDDCLPNQCMSDILDILARRGVKATFFIIGSNFLKSDGRPAGRARELLARVVAEGHAIGSHSFWHERLDEKGYRDSVQALKAELDRNEAAIDKVLGYHYPILYFRPPNGAHSTPRYALDRLLLERGQYLANWTITSFDWCVRLKEGNPDRLTPDKVLSRTLKQALEEKGGVVLLHGFPTTAAFLDELLGELSRAHNASGPLEFSTLDEIMELKYRGSGL